MPASNNTVMSISFAVGEDFSFPIALQPPTSVSGWSVELKAIGVKTQTELKLTDTNGITVSDVANGVFIVSFASILTVDLAPDVFVLTFRRTDDGNNKQYASGSLYLLPEV